MSLSDSDHDRSEFESTFERVKRCWQRQELHGDAKGIPGTCIWENSAQYRLFGNEFQNIEYRCAYTGMFEVPKAVEFRVNGKFRGFIFILRLQLRKNVLFRLGMIRKEAEKGVWGWESFCICTVECDINTGELLKP